MKYLLLFFGLIPSLTFAQTIPEESPEYRKKLDTLTVQDEEEGKPAKVFHAEPVYIDLIADLGARKGEHALEFGSGVEDHLSYYRYNMLLEYEFVPVDRLGFEIEVPITLYADTGETMNGDERERSRLNALRTATQYTFLVSEKWQTSMAVGYLNELRLPGFREYEQETALQGNNYHPFMVAAKRFGLNYHAILIAGPFLEHEFQENQLDVIWQVNSSFHYMIPGTRNFLGVEMNKEIEEGTFSMVVRPQMVVKLRDGLNLGFTAGLPINKETQRMSGFFRIMYDFN